MPQIKTRIYDFLRGFNPLYVAISLSMLMLAGIILNKSSVSYNGDILSYIKAWTDFYSEGEIDSFRTPVYPILLGIGRKLFGAENWALFPVLVQIITFYSCGILFSRMIFGVISDRRVAWFTVFLYFLFYPIINSLPLLTTEALSFSITSAWLYCVWRFLQHVQWRFGIYIIMLTLIGIMLRPSMLILAFAIVGLAMAGVFLKNYRCNTLLLLLTLLPVGIVYEVYVNEIECKTGIRTISVVSVYNNFYMARQYNEIFPDLLVDSPQALKLMLSYQEAGDSLLQGYKNNARWNEIYAFEKFGNDGLKQMKDYAHALKTNHPDVWFSYIAKRIIYSFSNEGPIKNICNYLVITLYTVFFVIGWIKLKRFSIVNFLILMIGGGSLLSIIFYAQNEFGRLMLPTSAVLILMGGQIINCIRVRPFSVNLRELYSEKGQLLKFV